MLSATGEPGNAAKAAPRGDPWAAKRPVRFSDSKGRVWPVFGIILW
jgi:hypothetical protein